MISPLFGTKQQGKFSNSLSLEKNVFKLGLMYTIGHKALTQSAIIIKLLDICIFFAENPSAD